MLNSMLSRAAVKSRSRANTVKRQRNRLLDEVSELKRKLAEVEGARDALRELNVELSCALKSLLAIVEWEHIQKVWMPDHACKQCRPGSELIVDGFKCGLHAARAVVIKIDSPAK